MRTRFTIQYLCNPTCQVHFPMSMLSNAPAMLNLARVPFLSLGYQSMYTYSSTVHDSPCQTNQTPNNTKWKPLSQETTPLSDAALRSMNEHVVR